MMPEAPEDPRYPTMSGQAICPPAGFKVLLASVGNVRRIHRKFVAGPHKVMKSSKHSEHYIAVPPQVPINKNSAASVATIIQQPTTGNASS
jgi:hypothetical protein